MDDSPTTVETACFEAGIKFGSLYHQFAGTPVSPESTESLERAIEESIENQPACTSVSVTIHPEAVRAAIEAKPGTAERGYTELTGRLMDVALVVEHEGCTVRARMEMVEGYPMMLIDSIDR